MTYFDWTEERVATLTSLWADKVPAAAIADRIGAPTRNTVLGKVHRLGLSRPRLPAHPKALRRGRGRPRRAEPLGPPMDRPPVAPAPAPAAEPPPADAIDLLALTNETCRFPVSGDGPPYLFCGAPGADFANGAPYCRRHSRITYRRPGEREG